MIRVSAVFVMFCSIVSVQVKIADASPAGCTRDSLQTVVDQYLDAVKKGDSSIIPLAPKIKYIENSKESGIRQGILQTALDIDFHRSIFDVETCQTFTELIRTNKSHPYVLGTRLKVRDGKVSEIETLVTDKDDWLFNADNYLMYSTKEKWGIIPPDQRSDRRTLINAASAYFDVFSDPASKVPWGTPCARLEGGIYTTRDFDDPNASCNVGIPEDGDVKLMDRHYVADPAMGSVVGFVKFGNENVPDSHLFRVENGKLRYIHTLTVCLIENCGFPPLDPNMKPPQ